jgi:hypothetical protein
LLVLGAMPASAQLTYSVTYEGPTISQQASGTTLQITEADLLTFGPLGPEFGPLPAPSVALDGAQLGLNLYSACQGHLPGVACGIEIDAISQGLDAPLSASPALAEVERVWFSVDEWSAGVPVGAQGPSVATEGGQVGDASSDIFVDLGLGPGPLPPGPVGVGNAGVFDGDGLPSSSVPSYVYPGLGLVEPNPPAQGSASAGDDLDAMDIAPGLGFPSTGYYISLDSSFVDPREGLPNGGSAALQGFSGADVLRVSAPGAAPVVFASAASLGLDQVRGVDSDDLDALVLFENGTGSFERSLQPYDWESGGTDMLLFSVRRGSAVIGRPDSIFGLPIEEGDILTTPLPSALGGLSPFPGIFYAAETLGLRTVRSGSALFGDDLDALDIAIAACFDCNNNGVEDSVDIATGGSSDVNNNGIPDECEKITKYCTCPGGGAPCGNADGDAGCSNSTGVGAELYFLGTSRVSFDDLVLVADGLPTGQFGIIYMGAGQLSATFGDGLRCVGGGGVGLFRYPAQNSGAGGTISRGPGLVAASCGSFPPSGCITAGSTWNFQFWYRDPAGPCGQGFNLSNGLKVDFVP